MIEFTQRTLQKLRNAQAQLVDEVGVPKVMELTNKSKTVVYRWKANTEPDLMSLPEVMRVEGYHRRPVVSKEMVWHLGFETTGTERCEVESNLELQVGEMVEHVSRLVVETARARSDGVITVSEANRLLGLLQSAERLIPAVKDTLIGVQVDGPLHVVGNGA
ncbi:hypothetical protein JYP49_21715 [Nitratireductor aquimarinus]|uniref:hypothetical protein n=1 Tax=Nitratireductor TaxID=245876 RepID=UPI0019D3CBF9|nr:MULTISPECIES: hypothetical protein [Nitratireductor]MBN7778878.1 hypothetical protein [Nitratireductor pacificus]MBN7783215.1 hypothetical protein [Nitratireductor pacificus]MBN7792016.1 hypothetical protein [Nitratireductor aquimarinus]MBY6101275.1 hypothetical protein [Nitratireductor aquimarinus]MCA1262696.1 hypothetical protein [Nitratireductor aquimarinus]